MDFDLSDEQLGLRDSTRRLLASASPPAAVRAIAESGDGFQEAVWRRGVDLGWAALAIPEAAGGLGQSVVDLALVAVEHGRAVHPSPFIPTVVVADAVARNERFDVLEALLSGESSAAWAFAEHGRPWTLAGARLAAIAVADGFRLNGLKVAVQDAGTAGLLLVDAILDGAPARFLVARDTPGVTVRRQKAFDITRAMYDVTFTDVALSADALLVSGDAAAGQITAGLHMITTLICAESVGVGERLLDMSVDYAKVRVQFDRPIASFQAIKHKCATMRIWLQASTAAMYYAAMALAEGTPDVARAVSVAKSYTSDAISRLAGEALQIHGGIGFTWEHDLHLYLRRAKSNELLYGDAATHREALCQAVERGEFGLAAG